jgi:hypothetical protein
MRAPTWSGRYKVAQHVSAGDLRGRQESPVGATQITLARNVGFLLSPLAGLGTAEGPLSQGLRPGLHSLRASGAALGEKCGLVNSVET